MARTLVLRPASLVIGLLALVAGGCDDYECDDKDGQVTCGYCDEDHMFNEYGGQCRYCPEGTTCSGDVCGELQCVSGGGGGGGGGTVTCDPGYCYTGVSCCPTTAPWQGGNSCFVNETDCHAAGYTTCYGC